MLISFLESASQNQINSVLDCIYNAGKKVHFINYGNSKTLILLQPEGIDISKIKSMSGLKSVKNITSPYKIASFEVHTALDKALSDGNQSLLFNEFNKLQFEINVLEKTMKDNNSK
jgi:hypothetical protein